MANVAAGNGRHAGGSWHWLRSLGVLTTDVARAVRAGIKLHFSVLGPLLIAAPAIVGIADIAGRPGNDWAGAALILAACLVLLTWLKLVAVPFVGNGMLPTGRTLNDVTARRRQQRLQREAWRERQRQVRSVQVSATFHRAKPRHARRGGGPKAPIR